MKVRVNVVFDMAFDAEGESKTDIKFKLPDYPGKPCPDSVQRIVLQEISRLAAMPKRITTFNHPLTNEDLFMKTTVRKFTHPTADQTLILPSDCSYRKIAASHFGVTSDDPELKMELAEMEESEVSKLPEFSG